MLINIEDSSLLGKCKRKINDFVASRNIMSAMTPPLALEINKICFSAKGSIQLCGPKSDSALPGAI